MNRMKLVFECYSEDYCSYSSPGLLGIWFAEVMRFTLMTYGSAQQRSNHDQLRADLLVQLFKVLVM